MRRGPDQGATELSFPAERRMPRGEGNPSAEWFPFPRLGYRQGSPGMTPRLMALTSRGEGKSIVRFDVGQRPAGGTGSHGFDQPHPGHVVERPAVLPGKQFQLLDDDVVQIANDDLVHGVHRLMFSPLILSNRRIVSVYPAPINPSHSSSEIIFTPRSWASLSFDPAPGPATTRSVFFDTEPATLAPSDSARALASLRLIFSSVPVKTTVLPPTGEPETRSAATSATFT